METMEGHGDYSGMEKWDRPTERLWDTPTESLHVESDRDHPANEDGGTVQASSGQTAEDASTTISDSEHGARRSRGVPRPRPRKQMPENLFSPPPETPNVSGQSPLRARERVEGNWEDWFRETERDGTSEVWADSPSAGVWETPTGEGLWDGPMERVTNEEGDRRRRPPEYIEASREGDEELPPTYEECVRLGIAK